ncbi:protein-tyrosine-phosphatase [Asanoa ishikariensis]|uniref:Protein tyrosine/serine phosphatase n=1 Tax=Asanoa ishikariensis TaxID=137265 RepID=A0A1H3N185_9ACTN|nr:tyrosine-protein phosphatase [Asanoa ishikariensis]GIF68951.1 protein-tyrosine-phosphatase [Asanoa ishikariensis]SDY81999.1 Protein tyrosine/serine phosphatase [Asanoa ishikariensis]
MILDWPDCTNVRDLGGLATTDGRRVRPEALLRSDGHHKLTADTVAAIRAGGVRRIVDLRWAHENARWPSPFAADPFYLNVPLLGDADYEIVPDSYSALLDHNRPQVGAAFRAVAEAPPGGVVVHCHEGKDRTGVLVALLLLVAGVAEDDIADDYALTADVQRILMVNTLDHLRQAYGGVAKYLADCGVDGAALAAARSRLLE